MSRQELGRSLPSGARFATVADLFAMHVAEREITELWLGPDYPGPSEWMSVKRLLRVQRPAGEASLLAAPSSMVVVVRTQA